MTFQLIASRAPSGAGAVAGAAAKIEAFLRRSVAIALLAASTVLAATAAGAQPECGFASLPEAKAMAERAAEFLRAAGPEAGLPAFMDPTGPFFDRDLYVFVVLLDGTIVVNGRYPELIGGSIAGAVNARGQAFGLELLSKAARAGRGTVEYEWYNPCTGQVADKVTYFVRVGDFVVAVGAYGSVSA